MDDMQFAFRISVIGMGSVFLVMIILMVVLQVFGKVVRRWGKQKEASEGKNPS
jgi:sodium pump decarboxylase gamma subunit